MSDAVSQVALWSAIRRFAAPASRRDIAAAFCLWHQQRFEQGAAEEDRQAYAFWLAMIAEIDMTAPPAVILADPQDAAAPAMIAPAMAAAIGTAAAAPGDADAAGYPTLWQRIIGETADGTPGAWPGCIGQDCLPACSQIDERCARFEEWTAARSAERTAKEEPKP